MAKILVQYEADTSQLQAKLKGVEQANTKVDESAKKTGNTISDSYTKGASAVGKAESQVKKTNAAISETSKVGAAANNVFGQISAGIGAAFAVQKIVEFAKVSVKAFVDSEAKTQRLKFALDNITKDGGAFDKLIKQSEDLQEKLKIFDSEDIQNIQAMQAQFGLTAKQIEKLTPLILELSVAQGVDITTATDTALKAIEGQTRGLKTVGASFEDTGNAIDNFNMLTEKLAKFQGTAADSLNTTNGQLKAQEVALGNIQEEIGERLAPKVTALKSFMLDLADAGVSALDDLGDGFDTLFRVINNFKLYGITGLTSALTNNTSTDINKLVEAARAANAKIVANYNKEFANLDTAALEKKLDTVENLLANAKEKRKNASDGIAKNLADQSITELASQVIAINGLIKERERGIQAEKEYTTNVIGFSKQRILAEIEELKQKTQSSDVQALIKIRKEALDLILKAEKEAGEKAAAQKEADLKKQKEASEKAAEQEIKAREQLEKELAKRSESNLPNILDAIDSDTTAQINVLKTKYIELGDFTEEAERGLNDKIKQVRLDGLKLKLAETKAAGESTVEIESQIADATIEINTEKDSRIRDSDKRTKEERIQALNDILQATQEVYSQLFELFGALNDSQIQQIEDSKTAQLDAFDAELEALEVRNERGADSDRVYESKKKALLEQRLAAEKKADAELRKLKTEQAQQDKLKSIFDTILNTSTAIVAMLAQGPAGIPLAIAAGITGALQLATIIATPIPKFFEGEKFVKRGSNPIGRDTIPAMLNEGERVVTTANNKKHWEIYEAIENNEFKKFVQKHYVMPQLRAYKANQEKQSQKDFAGNIAASLTQQGLSYYDADRIRKKGMDINNTKELASLIAESLSDKLPKLYGRW